MCSWAFSFICMGMCIQIYTQVYAHILLYERIFIHPHWSYRESIWVGLRSRCRGWCKSRKQMLALSVRSRRCLYVYVCVMHLSIMRPILWMLHQVCPHCPRMIPFQCVSVCMSWYALKYLIQCACVCDLRISVQFDFGCACDWCKHAQVYTWKDGWMNASTSNLHSTHYEFRCYPHHIQQRTCDILCDV